ncbi:MAG: response regulator transcription factor [Planctomycetes bacterium]|jgi:two-component system alkaline phosphatase synthesis response regulator PhoP|nr:response regulator transcription factor [Planctomycetota bacterium]
MPASALIVEDENEIADLVKFHLERDGMQVSVARNGRKAIEMVQGAGFDLIVLDLMLPDLDGLEICRRLKGQDRTKEIPVVMLTARGEESDIVAGLEMGADDYVTKPFSPRVLMARLRNALRKTGANEPTERIGLVNGRLLIDRERHVVTVDGQTIELTVTEFGILHFLALRPGFVRTRDQIISAVHGRNTVLSSRTVDVHVTAVRRKLGALGECVQTVRGVGYRFRDPNDLTE